MKFGKIYDFENIKEARDFIGKKVLYGNSYKAIKTGNSKKAFFGTLEEVYDSYEPFRTPLGLYQFIREIIEEEPKYRPFTDEELKEQVGKVVDLKNVSREMIGTRAIISSYRTYLGTGQVKLSNSVMEYYASELLEQYTFADGTPCGVKVEN